jgi:CRISPR/Cas system-associated exonuclease Cas4 (RecB family)
MSQDKFTATWVSHSSISDFLSCPRSYYLKNVYKDPQTRHKIKIMSPPLALGQAVHEVLESLSSLPTAQRFKQPLLERFQIAWKKVSGNAGGFRDADHESHYQIRGQNMIHRVIAHPGPLQNPAVKIQMDMPHYWLSEADNIILCGKIDWLEYLPQTDSINIIDFKTSTTQEDPASLQLPIYHLLVANCQHRTASRASYWYLDRDDAPTEKPLPDLEAAKDEVLKIAKKIKLARTFDRFLCPHQGCRSCLPFESVIKGQAQLIGVDDFGADVYVLPPKVSPDETPESIIL